MYLVREHSRIYAIVEVFKYICSIIYHHACILTLMINSIFEPLENIVERIKKVFIDFNSVIYKVKIHLLYFCTLLMLCTFLKLILFFHLEYL